MTRHFVLLFMLVMAACGQPPAGLPDTLDDEMSPAHRPLPPTRLTLVLPDTARIENAVTIHGEEDGGRWRLNIGQESIGRDFDSKVASVRQVAESLPSSETSNIQTLKVQGMDALFFTYRSRHCRFEDPAVETCNVAWLGIDTGARSMPRIEAHFSDDWKGRETVLEIMKSVHVMEAGQTGFEEDPFRFEPFAISDVNTLQPFRLQTYGARPNALGQRYIFGASLPEEVRNGDLHYLLVERPDPAVVSGLAQPFDCADHGGEAADCVTDTRSTNGVTINSVTFDEGDARYRVVRIVTSQGVLQVTGQCRGETAVVCLDAVDRVASALRYREAG